MLGKNIYISQLLNVYRDERFQEEGEKSPKQTNNKTHSNQLQRLTNIWAKKSLKIIEVFKTSAHFPGYCEDKEESIQKTIVTEINMGVESHHVLEWVGLSFL